MFLSYAKVWARKLSELEHRRPLMMMTHIFPSLENWSEKFQGLGFLTSTLTVITQLKVKNNQDLNLMMKNFRKNFFYLFERCSLLWHWP